MNKLVVFAIAFGLSVQVVAQVAVTKKSIVTLKTNESLVYSESCILINNVNSSYYLVTAYNDKYYINDNGKISGPYADLQQVDMSKCGGQENECNVYLAKESNDYSKFTEFTSEGKVLIKFNGKQYGPFASVVNMKINKNSTWFAALALNDNMKTVLVTSAGEKVELPGNAETLHISEAGNKALVAVKGSSGIEAEMMNQDFSNMSQEEMMKYFQELQKKQESAPKPQNFILLNDGTKVGPVSKDAIYTNNPAFAKNSGSNWFFIEENKLFINGNQVKTDGLDYLDACKIYISKDGKSYAVASYDKIWFSDGTTYQFPMKIEVVEKTGKNYIQWASLENQKNLVSYSREF